ncbi:hypothetical protein [Alteromonas sp. C1M14]|uniref:hypothetical protein n=1 Tax=Alteromonas sp. C1M14 TaxID=2841567 RepID=UPI001C09950A|nr:hypothetical protein [Alteromonas sp. C1M14]MBU2978419.1 hypothetical protein [Alteromonas sp. C1M14]
MTFRYPTTHSSPFFGVPLLYLSVCFLINFFTGTLDYEAISDERSQRAFNTAIGIPLLTTFFWITIRVQQQHVASIVMRYLLENNALSHFSLHRERLAQKLITHTYIAAIASIFVTLVYIISEDLLGIFTFRTMALYVMAFPFWFFFWLFMFQSLSSTHYLIGNFVAKPATSSQDLVAIKRVVVIATENTLFAITAMTITPIFWFNKAVPAIDACVLTFFSSVMLIYLALPAFKISKIMRAQKHDILNGLISSLRSMYASSKHTTPNNRQAIVEVEREIEAVEAVTTTYWGSFQFSKVMGVTLIVPASWLLIRQLGLLVLH